MKISKSSYMQWEFCPRAYKYVYIDGMRKPPTVPMQMGSSFHDYAKLFFQSLNYNALYDIQNKIQVKDIMLEASMRLEAPTGLQKPIENFLNFEVDRFWSIYESTPELYDDTVKYYKPVFLEEYLNVKDPFEGYDEIILSGILDRGDLTAKNSIALLEYKLSSTLNENTLQKELLFYSILYEKAQVYEYPVTDLVAYTPVTNEYIWMEMNYRKQKNVEKRIIQMIEDKKFPCKENIFCADCVGAEICLNAVVDVEAILNLLTDTGLAYTTTEITKKLNIKRGLVQAVLSDLCIEGQIKQSFKGRNTYWWVE